MKHKKILALILTMAMIFTGIPAAVFAEGETPDGQDQAAVEETQEASEEPEETEAPEVTDGDESVPADDPEETEEEDSAPVMGAPDQTDSIAYYDPVTGETLYKDVSELTKITSDMTQLESGWYYTDGETSVTKRIHLQGDVNIILCDDSELNAEGGIHVTSGRTLTIWGQSTGDHMGNLNASAMIRGSVIKDEEHGLYNGDAAIGQGTGNEYGDKAGTIIINGGDIFAQSQSGNNSSAGGAAIGGSGATIVINGGFIDANGGQNAAGIGGNATAGDDVSITINGGTIETTAKSANGVGIGLGQSSTAIATVTFDYPDGACTTYIKSVGYFLGNYNNRKGSVTLRRTYSEGDNLLDAKKYTQGSVPFAGNTTLVPLEGHEFTPEWAWSDDFSECAATFTCSVCGRSITLPATVERMPDTPIRGVMTCEATVVLLGVTYTTTTLPKAVVPYVDARGVTHYVTATIVDSTMTTFDSGWYFFATDISNTDTRYKVQGDVNIILGDGATFTNKLGTTVPPDSYLTIWGQKEGSGKWIVPSEGVWPDRAGIGGDYRESSGSIEINGGTFDITGGTNAAAIGSGAPLNNDGTYKVTINGGNIRAIGNNLGAGIGGQKYSTTNDSFVTINGGTIYAQGGRFGGAGIGGCSSCSGYVIINGGNITAQSGLYAAGIGGGSNGSGNVEIYGGNITAEGAFDGVGIGAGHSTGDEVVSSRVLIYGGIINAEAEEGLPGIGRANEGFQSTNSLTVIYPSEGLELTSSGYDGCVTIKNVPLYDKNNRNNRYPNKDYATQVDRNGLFGVTLVTDSIPYLDYNEELGQFDLKSHSGTADDTAIVRSDMPEYWNPSNSSYETYGKTWYVVTQNVTIDERIFVYGDVNLILCDGAAFTATKGFQVMGTSSLTIYGQSEGTGALTITSPGRFDAGIGGGDESTCGTIVIDGGVINTTGGEYGAGIGGGRERANYNASAAITINGGKIVAKGGPNAAGIGSGYGPNMIYDYSITINGGDIEASGAVGIGTAESDSNTKTNIVISGGVVDAATGGIGRSGSGDIAKTQIDLDYKDDVKITAGSYRGTVNLKNDFMNIEGNRIFEKKDDYSDKETMAGKTLVPFNVPIVTHYGMALTDLLRLKFGYRVPEGYDTTGAYVTFAGKHVDSSVKVPLVEESGYLVASIDLNVLQAAEQITPTLHILREATLVDYEGVPYSIEDYITTARSIDGFSDNEMRIVNAIADYAYYAQPLLSAQNGWTLGVDYDPITVAHSDYEDYLSRRDEIILATSDKAFNAAGSLSSLKSLTSNMVFDAAMEQDISVKPASGVTVTGVTYNGVAHEYITEKNKIKIPFTNIYAKDLANGLGNLTVSTSSCEVVVMFAPLSYVNASLSNTSETNKEARWKCMIAVYEYAMACSEANG